MKNADLTFVGEVIGVDNGIAKLDLIIVGDDSGTRYHAEISMRKLSRKGITDRSCFRTYVYAKSQRMILEPIPPREISDERLAELDRKAEAYLEDEDFADTD